MGDDSDWTGRSLVEYYVVAGVGKRLTLSRGDRSAASLPQAPDDEIGYLPRTDQRFEPSVLARYPEEDRDLTPMPADAADFCFPDGIRLMTEDECQADPLPKFASFVLTTADSARVYGVCITWMEPLPGVSAVMTAPACAPAAPEDTAAPGCAHVPAAEAPQRVRSATQGAIYGQRCVCLLSRVPAFDGLSQCCRQLYRLHVTQGLSVLQRHEVEPALSARVGTPGEVTSLVVAGLQIDVQAPRAVHIPKIMTAPLDWLLVTRFLDAHNLIIAWSLLLAEHKVLFISSQPHVLTMACETLSACLWPLKWHHVYIPVLPARLASFLQAPVPFMVGATPDVLKAAGEDVPTDVARVNLDENVVIVEARALSSLRLPPRAKRKLLGKLVQVCRPPSTSFITPSAVSALGQSVGGLGSAAALVTAFQLPPNPEEADRVSEAGYDSDGTEATDIGTSAEERASPLAQMTRVRSAFLRFFTSVFERLQDLYVMPPANVSQRAVPTDFFDEERFLGGAPEPARPWLRTMVRSQAFTEFLHARLLPATRGTALLELALFNEAIDAKRNRSRRVWTKRPTPLLDGRPLPPDLSSEGPRAP